MSLKTDMIAKIGEERTKNLIELLMKYFWGNESVTIETLQKKIDNPMTISDALNQRLIFKAATRMEYRLSSTGKNFLHHMND